MGLGRRKSPQEIGILEGNARQTFHEDADCVHPSNMMSGQADRSDTYAGWSDAYQIKAASAVVECWRQTGR